MPDMRQHLRAIFADVLRFLVAEGLQKRGIVQQNPHGDATQAFLLLLEWDSAAK